MQMTQEDRDEWVAALRSGKYQQGRGGLLESRSNTACCLGVLCDLQVAKGVLKKDPTLLKTRFYDPRDEEEGSFAALPLILQERFSCGGGVKVQYEGNSDTLMTLNDVTGLSFSAIADIIENQVEIIPSYPT